MFLNSLPWVPVISFLIYLPFICYLDWKYRDIKTHKIWLPLIAVNVPITLIGYFTGYYSPILLALSIIGVILWFALMRLNFLPGGDFVFLSLISVFVLINPVSISPFMLMFSFYLIGMTAATFWAILIDNRIRKRVWSLKMENGIPFLIPISVAFVLALFSGGI